MLNPIAAIVASLALGTVAVSAPALIAPSSIVVQQTAAATRAARREPHPEIRKAIVALESAKRDMQRASHDFGGHRVAALAACDNAIAQLRLALQYDKR